MSTDHPNHYPTRGRPIHQPEQTTDNRSIIIFVTVCTQDRQLLLATPALQQILCEAWSKAAHWFVGRYVIMPDHIHLFCAPATNPPESLKNWIGYWKRLVVFGCPGFQWQKNFWDTQLRGHESYAQKWDYVRHNPVRADLVNTPEAWPYQGELNELRWHD